MPRLPRRRSGPHPPGRFVDHPLGRLGLTAFGVLGWLGPFWALPTAFLREQGAAGGIALINSMGAVGGFVGPYLIGEARQRTGGFTAGLLILALCLVGAVAIVIGLRRARPVARLEIA